MSRIVGVLNFKGGTGKTTTVVNVAAGLALRDARVLCVDLDPQGGLTTALGVDSTYSLSHLLLGRAELEKCIVQARENLDVLGSDQELSRVEGELWRLNDRQMARRWLGAEMRSAVGYDYILLDFSPAPSLLSESGLAYAQEIIVPVTTDYMSLVGTRQVIDKLRALSDLPGRLPRLSLIVPTFYRSQQRKDREVIEILERHFAGRVAEPIRADVKLSEAPSHGMTIFEYAPGTGGASDYSCLVERIAGDG